jgi:hypothetical protein
VRTGPQREHGAIEARLRAIEARQAELESEVLRSLRQQLTNNTSTAGVVDLPNPIPNYARRN